MVQFSLNLQYLNSRTKEAENVSLKLSILTERTEIGVIASKLEIYILASKGDKSDKVIRFLLINAMLVFSPNLPSM